MIWFNIKDGFNQSHFDEIVTAINPGHVYVYSVNHEGEYVYTLSHHGLDKRNPVKFDVTEVELLNRTRDGSVLEFLGVLAIQHTIAG